MCCELFSVVLSRLQSLLLGVRRGTVSPRRIGLCIDHRCREGDLEHLLPSIRVTTPNARGTRITVDIPVIDEAGGPSRGGGAAG